MIGPSGSTALQGKVEEIQQHIDSLTADSNTLKASHKQIRDSLKAMHKELQQKTRSSIFIFISNFVLALAYILTEPVLLWVRLQATAAKKVEKLQGDFESLQHENAAMQKNLQEACASLSALPADLMSEPGSPNEYNGRKVVAQGSHMNAVPTKTHGNKSARKRHLVLSDSDDDDAHDYDKGFRRGPGQPRAQVNTRQGAPAIPQPQHFEQCSRDEPLSCSEHEEINDLKGQQHKDYRRGQAAVVKLQRVTMQTMLHDGMLTQDRLQQMSEEMQVEEIYLQARAYMLQKIL
jgi:hypothetical protein